MMGDLGLAYQTVQGQIERAAKKAGRPAEDVTLIAVSKKQPIEKIEVLYRLGQRDFGENYVQELLEKAAQARALGLTELRWHFIGHLQTNKVKALLPQVFSVHSVNSVRLAQSLAKVWETLGSPSPLPVFIEVDLSGEISKSGVAIVDLPEIVAAVSKLGVLQLQGLMCIPSPMETPQGLIGRFQELKALEQGLGAQSGRKLSMGMSSDFEVAIEQGATHVRVGTSLFGPR